MNNESNPQNFKYLTSLREKILLGNLANFSIVELLTLVLLQSKNQPIRRHSLYLEINELTKFETEEIFLPDIKNKKSTEILFLQSLKKTTDLSTSSFYSSLVKLESLKLIRFNKSKNGKIETVEATLQTLTATNIIYNSLLRLRMMTGINLSTFNIKKFLNMLNANHFKNFLLVLNNEGINSTLLEYIHESVDELYIISSEEETINELKNLGYKDIKISTVHNGLIREPENVFEACFFRLNPKNSKLLGLTQSELLTELARVVEPEGRVFISSRADFPRTNHGLADFILDSYKESIINYIYSEEEIKELLAGAGLQDRRRVVQGAGRPRQHGARRSGGAGSCFHGRDEQSGVPHRRELREGRGSRPCGQQRPDGPAQLWQGNAREEPDPVLHVLRAADLPRGRGRGHQPRERAASGHHFL